MTNELERLISVMSDAEKVRFQQDTRLAMIFLQRVTPRISETAKLLEKQRKEEKLLERIWGGLWIIAGLIALLTLIDFVDETTLYYPGVFMAAIFIRQWLSPISRFDFEIANLEAYAFPVLIRMEELGLSTATVFSWVFYAGFDADFDRLRECRDRYCRYDDLQSVEEVDDNEDDFSLSEFDGDDFSEALFSTREEVWFHARLEIARHVCPSKRMH